MKPLCINLNFFSISYVNYETLKFSFNWRTLETKLDNTAFNCYVSLLGKRIKNKEYALYRIRKFRNNNYRLSQQRHYCKKHSITEHITAGNAAAKKARQGALWRQKINNLNIVDDAILQMFSHQQATKKFEKRCSSSRNMFKLAREVN